MYSKGYMAFCICNNYDGHALITAWSGACGWEMQI